MNISALVRSDFKQQWWLMDNEDNSSHNLTKLCFVNIVLIEGPHISPVRRHALLFWKCYWVFIRRTTFSVTQFHQLSAQCDNCRSRIALTDHSFTWVNSYNEGKGKETSRPKRKLIKSAVLLSCYRGLCWSFFGKPETY